MAGERGLLRRGAGNPASADVSNTTLPVSPMAPGYDEARLQTTSVTGAVKILGQASPATTMHRLRAWLAVLLVVAVTYVTHDRAAVHQAGGDSIWTIHQSLGLLQDHTFTLSGWEDLLEAHPGLNWHRNAEGDPVFDFPWGTALASTPIVGALAVREKLSGRSLRDNIRAELPLHELENTVASVWVALTAGLLMLLAYRELGSWPAATLVALLFAFATSAFSTMSRALWSHTSAAFFLALALLILQSAARSRRGERLLWLLGPVLVLAYACRPTMAVVAAALLVVVAKRHPQRLAGVLAAGAVSGGVYVLVNLSTYGSVQSAYFSPGRLFGSPTFFEALAGNWVSPNRGLLVWSPVLIFAAVGVVVARRAGTFDVLHAAAVVAIALHWLVISTLEPWFGGWTTGSRLFSEVLPLFVLLMLPAIDMLRRGWGPGLWSVRAVFAVLLLFSLFTNVRGGTRIETHAWNGTPDRPISSSRMWEWGDLQFLR
jgi:hypothetical protein